LVAAPYLSPNDWTPRLDAYFASPLALCARRVSSAASRLLGSTSLRFALHGWQRQYFLHPETGEHRGIFITRERYSINQSIVSPPPYCNARQGGAIRIQGVHMNMA
ncbi:hypothetical protein, partial [Thiolapillus sp.]|uniref:hypothetical protein n=1 Tax=Thiolapillus sp. TaxID=2017437 RepID=UPI003AF9BC2B